MEDRPERVVMGMVGWRIKGMRERDTEIVEMGRGDGEG